MDVTVRKLSIVYVCDLSVCCCFLIILFLCCFRTPLETPFASSVWFSSALPL